MPWETGTASPSNAIARALQWSACCLVIVLSLGILFVEFLGFLSSGNSYLKIFDGGNNQPHVPCYFIFGDSTADDGNNNNLSTLSKSNYSPYGVDFPDGPTGRFTNGRLMVDFIAQFLGFDEFIPPFANLTGQDILKGVNYASASSGIRDETGTQTGQIISVNQQLRNHLTTVSRIAQILKSKSAAKEYLGKCVYTILTGSNDYINNYFVPSYYNTSSEYTLEHYADVLVKEYSEQLKTLHSYGARKVAVFGLGLLYKLPEIVAVYGSNSSIFDTAVKLFNSRLLAVVYGLNAQLTGATFTYINNYEISETISTDGLNTTGTCCQVVEGEGLCISGSTPCSNRSQYAFFDGYHPTEVIYEANARRAYKRMLSSDALPYDISHLEKLDQYGVDDATFFHTKLFAS
ncbi:hypothetical protein SAY87_007392 [Trapa incisa]|uniref:GDSL esterase/lipase n=1 Tax=Trapa incisa TaxID=236973 RepID=A0AAN7Q5P8_9MYRT|nr:hypothetical protein SAY87_007392 [Trapa incisa]